MQSNLAVLTVPMTCSSTWPNNYFHTEATLKPADWRISGAYCTTAELYLKYTSRAGELTSERGISDE